MATIALGMLAINLWTGAAFWYDKRCALRGQRRTPEARLLGLALAGGTPAAFLARRLFRHKTRKQPFSTYLHLIAAVQGGLAIGFFAL